MRISIILRGALASLCLVASAGPVFASPVHLGWANVTMLAGGWWNPNMRVTTSGAFQNPAGCAISDGYIIEATLPGAALLQSMLLTACATGAEVLLTVDGCVLDRPRSLALIFASLRACDALVLKM